MAAVKQKQKQPRVIVYVSKYTVMSNHARWLVEFVIGEIIAEMILNDQEIVICVITDFYFEMYIVKIHVQGRIIVMDYP